MSAALEKNIIGRTTRCVDSSCKGWLVDSFLGKKYWIQCIDPKHNTNSNIDIEKVEEEEGKVTRPANPNLNRQQASTTSQRCTSIQ